MLFHYFGKYLYKATKLLFIGNIKIKKQQISEQAIQNKHLF